MTKTYRVGIVGVCHVHVHNVANIFKRHPQVQLVACADTRPAVEERTRAAYSRAWNLDYLRKEMGIPQSYDDYEQMLAKENLDIVICNSENSKHPEVVRACAAAGIHVCVEKPMAGSLADAYAMLRAAESAKIVALVHWYMPFSQWMQQAEKLIREGTIGRILEVRMRVGHAGPLAPGVRHPGPEIETAPMSEEALASTWWYQPQAGGGAMIDFCSYGAIIARWLIGEQAIAVMGLMANLNSRWSDADDNGSMMIRFREALGICHGSWSTVDPGVCGGPVIYGTRGTLVVDEWCAEPAVKVCRGSGNVEVYQGLCPPEGRRTVAEELVHHLETGSPLHPTLGLELNTEATAILEAGMRSAATGRLELVPNRCWATRS